MRLGRFHQKYSSSLMDQGDLFVVNDNEEAAHVWDGRFESLWWP